MTVLLTLPVLLPLLGAALSLMLGRRPDFQRVIGLTVLSGVVVITAVLVYHTDTEGPVVLQLGGYAAPFGITLIADRLASLLLLVSAVVTLAVLVFSIGQRVTDYGRETASTTFQPAYLVLCAGVSLAYITGDLLNLFVAFEIMLSASYVLITRRTTARRVRAGMTYVIVSLTSSLLFITLVALVYAATGTVNLAALSLEFRELAPGVQTSLALLATVVFGIKAALVPLHFWLPDSYPTAPAPITAVFAGYLTKVGVYALIRIHTLVFQSEHRVERAARGVDRHHDRRSARCDRAGGHQPSAVVPAGQPHRVHVVRTRHGDGHRPFGCDPLRRPPHHRASRVVPGQWSCHPAYGHGVAAGDVGCGQERSAGGRVVRRARAEPRGHPAVLRVHRQDHAVPGRSRKRHGVGVCRDRGGGAHEFPHVVRGDPDLGECLLGAEREPFPDADPSDEVTVGTGLTNRPMVFATSVLVLTGIVISLAAGRCRR